MGRQANKPRRWKNMLDHKGWFNLLIYATFTRITNYRVSIYIRLHTVTNPVSGKACSPTKGGLICLYMQPLLASQTTEFVICISIYIKLHAVTLLPPPRSLVPRLGLGNTWVRQLRSGSSPYPTAATKCNVLRSSERFYYQEVLNINDR